MASTHSLLYAAESDVTIERVRALVKQVGPEAPTIEYKEQMADSIARGVAALANTYGGLLLVGVTDKPRIVKGVNEKTIESVAEHCAAKIEPPWVPPIIPVPLGQGSDLYVLVLRVVPGQHPRPLLVDGVAPVRHQNTTHPADWQRLRDLFAEAGAVLQDDAWTIQAPSLPQGADGTSDSNVDLVIRSGLDFPVSREAKWRPLSERTVAAFTGALERSPLTSVMASIAGRRRRPGHDRPRPVRSAPGSPDLPQIVLVGLARRRDHSRFSGQRHLHRDGSHATRATIDEDRVAGLDAEQAKTAFTGPPATPVAAATAQSIDGGHEVGDAGTVIAPRRDHRVLLVRAFCFVPAAGDFSEGDRSPMRIHRVAGVLVVAAIAGGLLAGCGSKPTPRPASTPPPPAASSAAPNPQQQHNQADVVFLQNMIPHHAQAITMSQAAGNQATSPQVKGLATRIETEQSPQAQQMSDLLTAWGTPTPAAASVGTAGSLGHGQTAVTISGATFDRMFLQVMIVHHQDAVTMSQTELAQGNNPATRNLAQQIISAQQAEISEMQALLQVI